MIVSIVLAMLTQTTNTPHKHTMTQDIFLICQKNLYPNAIQYASVFRESSTQQFIYHLMYLLPPQPFSLWQLKYTPATGAPRLQIAAKSLVLKFDLHPGAQVVCLTACLNRMNTKRWIPAVGRGLSQGTISLPGTYNMNFVKLKYLYIQITVHFQSSINVEFYFNFPRHACHMQPESSDQITFISFVRKTFISMIKIYIIKKFSVPI